MSNGIVMIVYARPLAVRIPPQTLSDPLAILKGGYEASGAPIAMQNATDLFTIPSFSKLVCDNFAR